MVGVEIGPYPYEAAMGARVCRAARKHGVIVRPLGNTIVILPPLSILDDEIAQLCDAIRAAIGDICA